MSVLCGLRSSSHAVAPRIVKALHKVLYKKFGLSFYYVHIQNLKSVFLLIFYLYLISIWKC